MKAKSNFFHAFLISAIMVGTVAVQAQRGDRSSAVQAIQAGDYSRAVTIAKQLLKSNGNDDTLWQTLGSAQYKLKKYKDAIKSYQNAVELAPTNASHLSELAYVYLTVFDPRTYKTAADALVLDPNNAVAHYVLGVNSYRDESYVAAYDRAKRAISLDPTMPAPYRLKSQALVASFLALAGKVLPPAMRGDLLIEAVGDLEKYYGLVNNPDLKADIQYELDTLRYFSNYYSLPENKIVRDASIIEPPDPTNVLIKILSKPKPSYTDSARSRSVEGTVKLLVAFDKSGRVGPILVIKSLDDDLDRQAVRAALGISFKPPTRNGVPFSVVKQVEYTFDIY